MGAWSPGDELVTVARSYPDILAFLEDWRSRLRTRSFFVADEPALVEGARVVVQVEVPVLDRSVRLPGRVVAVGPEGAQVELDPDEAARPVQELDAFFQLTGRLMRALIATGRFQLARPGEAGARPAASARSPAAAPPSPAVSGASPAGPGGAASVGAGGGLPQLHDRPTIEGEMGGEAFRSLLMRLYKDGATGLLDIELPGVRRVGWVVKGGPVQFAADPVVVEDTLGTMLLRAGRLTDDQLRESLDRMNRTGLPQGECLIEMGVMSYPTLVMALGKQAEIVCRNLLRVTEGRFAFHPRERFDQRFINPAVKTPAMLFDVLRGRYKDMGQDEIAALLDPLLDQYVVIERTFNWGDLRLKKAEMELVEILAGRSYRLREVFSVSSMGRAGTTTAALALRDLQLLYFTEGEDAAQTEARAGALLGAKLEMMAKQNHFERLEIHWSARTSDVERARARLVAEYEAFGQRRRLTPEQDEQRRKVLEMVQESVAVLANPSSRQTHRKSHYEPQQCEFSADLLFRQGEMLVMKNQWDAVIENFERAAELQPQNKRYQQAAAAARARTYKSGGGADDED